MSPRLVVCPALICEDDPSGECPHRGPHRLHDMCEGGCFRGNTGCVDLDDIPWLAELYRKAEKNEQD